MAGWIQVVNGRIKSAIGRALLGPQFLTTIPLPNLTNVSQEDIRGSSVFFPLVGVFLGILLWAMEMILRMVLPNLVSTSIALTLYTLLTGALHLDGLMDTADALGSRKPREQALEIMKDSRVGAMGVIAALLVYTGKLAALDSLPLSAFGVIVIPPVLSRFAMVLAMKMAPPARGNEGLAGLFAQKISLRTVWTATLVSIVFTFWFNPIWLGTMMWLACVLVAVLATTFLTRRFGGMTGDTYGALNEIVEWTGWILGLALLLHK